MEGSESEAVFDSLNLNPRLFINEALNSVDDLVDGAFDYFNQQASALLKVEGTDRSEDLSKGVAHIRNSVQSALETRLAMWEKYCLRHCFAVPEGFSLPKSDESSGGCLMDHDTVSDPEVDADLDSLREKLNSVGKECAGLKRELERLELERQSALSNHCADSVREAIQLYEQHSVHEMFLELTKTSSELRAKVDKLRTNRVEETARIEAERMRTATGDFRQTNHGNGLFNAKLEELQEFFDDMNTTV